MNNIKVTTFQKMVWNKITKIPKGKTLAYEEIAIRIGEPQAYHAVVNACVRNLKLLTIPCHKVMRSSGKMG